MHACLGSGENRFVASAEISSAVLPASPSFSVLLFEVRMAFESGPAAASESARFLVKTDEDVLHLLENAVPQNTRKSTDMWVGILASFCSERKIDFDLSTCSAQELNDVLCKFYPGLRTKKGELYKKSSYFAARAAVHRKVQELGRPFNLFKSVEFSQSHRVLDATLKVKKLDGEELSVRHKASLTQEDLSRLEAYFSDVLQANDPIKLTEFVWYVITLHFGLRAREIQVQLRKSDLEFRSDDSGDYFVLNKDFASKNCQGGTKGREFETIGRVQNAHQVKALRLFLSKLNPGVERLFQRARNGIRRRRRRHVVSTSGARKESSGHDDGGNLSACKSLSALHESLCSGHGGDHTKKKRSRRQHSLPSNRTQERAKPPKLQQTGRLQVSRTRAMP